MALWGGIEAGGTKMVCAIAKDPHDIIEEIRFPTTSPQETITHAVAFFQRMKSVYGPIAAVGIASFGPLDPNRDSPTYGHITTTPKAGWANTDFIGPIKSALQLPVGLDTDVNGAALAEGRWGAARGLDTFIYLTIGTGFGGGGLVNGQLIHGLMHPEMGHVFVPHDREKDPFEGLCPYHGDCLEGLASGPAIEARWGQKAETLPPDHPAWELEADYIAAGLIPMIYVTSPQRIILGGGVMEQQQLFPMVRAKVQEKLNRYLQLPAILETIDEYIVAPSLGNQAGVLGAIALAQYIVIP